MQRLPLAGLLLLLLGACPPGKDAGSATDAGSSSGAASTTTTGDATAGSATGATSDMSSGTSTTTTGDATTGDATTGTQTTGDDATSTSTGDATTGTSGTQTGTSTGGATNTFFCDACLCDADATYCRKVLAGLVDIPPEPPLCPVVPEDPLLSGCVAYPEACGDTPTCDCIPNLNNNCFCEESMGTFTLTCPLP